MAARLSEVRLILKGYRLWSEQNAHTYVTHTHAGRELYQETLINTNELDFVIRSPAAFMPPPVSIKLV